MSGAAALMIRRLGRLSDRLGVSALSGAAALMIRRLGRLSDRLGVSE